MDLTTKERVRILLGQPTNTAVDQFVELKIDAISARVESLLGRHTETKQRTEYFDVPLSSRAVQLKGFPITSIRYVWCDSGREFGITDTTVSTTVNADNAAAQKVLKVAATTGFAVDDVLAIGESTARDETGVIASITAGVSLTLDDNLTYAHTAAQADAVKVLPTGDAEDSDYYTADATNSGLVYFDWRLDSGPKAVKITYTGGMATTTATFMTGFPDLADAVAEQVAYAWRMRDAVGTIGREGKGGATKHAGGETWALQYGDMIPELVSAIRRYQVMSVI